MFKASDSLEELLANFGNITVTLLLREGQSHRQRQGITTTGQGVGEGGSHNPRPTDAGDGQYS